jgi:hypothetical protein
MISHARSPQPLPDGPGRGTVPLDIKLKPAFAGLPSERRNLAARDALVRRVRGEFDEMRGLSLTVTQASRLFGIRPDACNRILAELMAEGFLREKPTDQYGRQLEEQ